MCSLDVEFEQRQDGTWAGTAPWCEEIVVGSSYYEVYWELVRLEMSLNDRG